jgi:hypothetical protein
MSLFWVVASVVAQLGLAMMLFLLVAFSGGGIANQDNVSRSVLLVIDVSLYVLPLLCLASAGLMIHGYLSGATARAYGWHLLPLPAAVAYVLFALSVSGSSR